MGRIKEHELAKFKKEGLRGYEAMWSHILSFGDRKFTIIDIEKLTSAHRDSVRDYVKRLVRAGYVEQKDEKRDKAILYRLVKRRKQAPRLRRNGEEVPRSSARDNMWRTIKMLNVFTAKDLAVSASTKTQQISLSYAKNYIVFLNHAGYLKTLKSNKGRSSMAQYKLLPGKNTGPKAPLIQRNKSVYDPNIEQVVWRQGQGDIS